MMNGSTAATYTESLQYLAAGMGTANAPLQLVRYLAWLYNISTKQVERDLRERWQKDRESDRKVRHY